MSKKIKVSVRGWTGKSIRPVEFFSFRPNGGLIINEIYQTKGPRKDWWSGNWPPREVRVTVEEI